MIASRTVILQAHTNFSNHDYFLSPPIPVNVSTAVKLCNSYGGYLAEVNDKYEMKFINDFLFQESKNVGVMVGATDADVEGGWKFIHSGDVVDYFHWAGGNPTNTDNKDCMYLYTVADFEQGGTRNGMVDDCCTCWKSQRFLCEMPRDKTAP